MDWKLSENCGVFGCIAADPWPANFGVSKIIYTGLLALQHRGQESCGIVTNSGKSDNVSVHKGQGLVNTVFNSEILEKLKGNLGIGHTRYSTAGKKDISHCQPFMVHTKQGLIAVAHNGELANAHKLRDKIWNHGVGLSTLSDSELVAQLISLNPPCGEMNGPNWFGRFKQLMESSLTAYSLVILQKDRLFGVRDPYGNRPLCLGRLKCVDTDKPLGWVISSESCSLQSTGAEYVREVLPGEVVSIDSTGISSLGVVDRPDPHSNASFCIFEYVYFSRPDSLLEGQSVYTVRKRCGKYLAMEAYVEADVVSTVPESATPAAFGFSEQSKIPYAEVLCKNRYAGRSFIQPNPQMRQDAVSIKFGPLTDNIKGKRIILVDDSIVRGTTIGPIVRLLRRAGATEVHIRVASPPIKYPCYMGINIPSEDELIANKFNPEQLANHIGADSLKYLSVEGLKMAVSNKTSEELKSKCNHCTACLTGHYPTCVETDW